jgi:adenylate cyclase
MLLIVVAVLASGLGVLAHAVGVFHRTELATIDARFSVRGPRPALTKGFLVVGVDSQTLNYFTNHQLASTWPYPRRIDARVIDNLKRAGAREIAFDVQFTEPTDDADDFALAKAVKRAGHMALATTAVGPHGTTDVLGPPGSLSKLGHARAGDATVIPDSDGVWRRMQWSYQGLQTFGVAIAEAAGGRRIAASEFGGPTASVPIDYSGPPGTLPHLSYANVYTGKFPPSKVRGKIVIVGVTDPVLQDVHATPTSSSAGNGRLMAGSEIVANEAATALHGIPLRDAAGWVNVLLIVLLGSIPPLLGVRGWALRALLGAVVAAVLYLVACQLSFGAGRIITVIDPLFALVLGAIGTLAVVYLGEAFERQYARSTFARFVPPGVVDEVLASTDDDLRLAGVERVCTVMFSDLRGFTRFSEDQPVERVIEVVNHYLEEMTHAILDAGGTLIAYMGDGIMAVFGAPLEQVDHADRALRAAREMLYVRLPRFNAWLAEQGHEAGFKMGIGLNSGTVMCGNVGAEQRVEYTAIGDTTNTASRLEGMTKGQPHMLFVAESTRDWMQAAPADLQFFAEFEVRSREQKLRVYSIPDPPGFNSTPDSSVAADVPPA